MIKNLNNRINEIVEISQKKQEQINMSMCEDFKYLWDKNPNANFCTGCKKYVTDATYSEYDSETHTCKVTKYKWTCSKWATPYCWGWGDKSIGGASVERTQTFLMPTVNRDDLQSGEGDQGGISNGTTSEADYLKEVGVTLKNN